MYNDGSTQAPCGMIVFIMCLFKQNLFKNRFSSLTRLGFIIGMVCIIHISRDRLHVVVDTAPSGVWCSHDVCYNKQDQFRDIKGKRGTKYTIVN